jgi:hypothetical protein
MDFFTSYKNAYKKEKIKSQSLQILFDYTVQRYNNLVNKINKAGGEQIFTQQFSKEELRTLLILCHPDKHNGSTTAHKISTKINSIRQ